MAIISFIFLIPCLWYFDTWHWFIFIVGGIIALAYSFPVFSLNGIRYSLRSIPYAKLFIVVTVWVLMTVLIAIRLPELKRPEVTLVLLERVCFLLAITMPFDIRNMDRDRTRGIITFPSKFGWKKSLNLSYLFISAFAVAVLMGFLGVIHNSIEAVALESSALITFFVIRKSGPDSHAEHYAIFLEGTSFMQSLLICFSYLTLSFI
jgi:4-hydroxybenzoate polyprenyltransferase